MKMFQMSRLRLIHPRMPSLVRWSSSKSGQGKIRNVVLVDACRTPFCVSQTDFNDVMSVDLQKEAIRGLFKRTGADPSIVEHVICGIVSQDCATTNVAREAALLAAIPASVTAHTITQACISSSMAVATGMNSIKLGMHDVVVAGGVELLSDIPIKYDRKAASAMFNMGRAKSLGQQIELGTVIGKNLLNPRIPAVAEFTSGESMGHSADRLAASFSVSRKEQDEFALRSHTLAAAAQKEGKLSDVIPVMLTGKKPKTVKEDNGIRVSTIEKLSTLKPSFIKPHGTVTAGNSSFLTDGASACLLMAEDYALANGFKPKAYIRAYEFVAQDPIDQLLLSPAYAIPRMLKKAGLGINDVSVYEIHEAFAGQVLANLSAMDSDHFCKKWMGTAKFGRLPMEKINSWGGSLAIGHPFAATGVRLIAQSAERLKTEKGQYAVLSACAAGGQGMAMLMENYAK